MSYDYGANVGKMDTDALLAQFGLKSGDSDYSEGSSTGVKGNPSLGEGYLSKKDYGRLKNSDEIWDAYAAVNGDDAMQEKRESNPDGLSINALDATLDKMSDGQKEEAGVENENPTFNEAEFSPQIQSAIERSNAYRDRAWSGQTAQDIYGKSNSLADGAYQGINEGSGYSGVNKQNSAASATDNYFNSDKYKIDLKNKSARSKAAQA